MIGYAGDTWGIPGPTFLRFYVDLAAAVVACAALWRIGLAVQAQRRRSALGPAELAYQFRGADVAVYGALAALRAAGLVDLTAEGRLTATGEIRPEVPALDRAVHDAAARGESPAGLHDDPAIRRELDAVRERLVAAGCRYSPAHRRQIRACGWAIGVVLLFGLVRLVAGVLNHKPVGELVGVLIILTVLAVVLGRVPRTTIAGRRLLHRLRRRNPHLAPSRSPSWAVYGASDAALAVGLFGMGSLWTSDSAFAGVVAPGTHPLESSGYSGGSCGSAGSCSSAGGCGSGGGGCGG